MSHDELLNTLYMANSQIEALKLELTRAENRAEDLQIKLDQELSK